MGGRRSLYPGKDGGRVQGELTSIGLEMFEQARKELADLSGWDIEDVSDADTIEFMARVTIEQKSEFSGEEDFGFTR